MTPKERVSAAFEHKNTDRTPIFEYVMAGHIPSALLGRDYFYFDSAGGRWDERVREIGLDAALAAYAKDRLDLAERLGHDLIYIVPNPPASHGGVMLNVLDYDCDGPDPAENVRLRTLKRREQMEKGLLDPDECFLVYEYINQEMQKRGLEIDLFAPAYFHGVWTDVDLMQTMLLDEQTARVHFELCTRMSVSRMDKLRRYGVRLAGVGGDFAGNRPLISPRCYREFIVPEVRKCAEHAHALGMWAVNASDGDLWYVIEDFLTGTGVDAYMEIDMGAGMDLGKLKARFGNRITLMGNMDCGSVLSFMSPVEIGGLTLACIEAGRGSGGHIFTASNAITEGVPAENYLAMVNAYRRYFCLPEILI